MSPNKIGILDYKNNTIKNICETYVTKFTSMAFESGALDFCGPTKVSKDDEAELRGGLLTGTEMGVIRY
jgi:hypothetical protein